MKRITIPPLKMRKKPSRNAKTWVSIKAFLTVSGLIKPLWVTRTGTGLLSMIWVKVIISKKERSILCLSIF